MAKKPEYPCPTTKTSTAKPAPCTTVPAPALAPPSKNTPGT